MSSSILFLLFVVLLRHTRDQREMANLHEFHAGGHEAPVVDMMPSHEPMATAAPVGGHHHMAMNLPPLILDFNPFTCWLFILCGL